MKNSNSTYIPTIGIECHVQLKTKTKLFSAVSNDARNAKPNTLISHIDLGMPGALPVLNKKAVELACKAAFALNTVAQKFSKFDRKHYFYPDLPKGYQITQFSEPIILGGYLDIIVNDETKRVHITRAHLEEDAGKSTHPDNMDYSLVDLNRAGTPLLEIVSEPDMHSSQEAKAYARELYLQMRYAEVSDADLYYGNMRFDVNVSLTKDPKVLGTRTETKNLNSFKSVEKTVEYEIKRQTELLSKGQNIVQETRGWDDSKQKTFSQRSKEESHDYRYMPDPDLPPVLLAQDYIDDIKSQMPVLPSQLRNALDKLSIDTTATETLIEEITAGKLIWGLIDNNVDTKLIKKIANWLVTDVQATISSGIKNWDDVILDPKNLVKLAKLTEESQLSSTAAKNVLMEMINKNGDPLQIAKSKNLLQESDESELKKIVTSVLKANPEAASDIKSGEHKAIGFIIGQVMRESRGKANPALTQRIIRELSE